MTADQEVNNVTAQTVNKVMQQRLTRGTPVIVANSFGQAKLRGKTQIVTSKGPVKCNQGGRCAGDWCIGLAVFVTDEKSSKKDKKMGWRANTIKVCLTHLKDESGTLILPPPLLQQPNAPVRETVAPFEIEPVDRYEPEPEPEPIYVPAPKNGSDMGEVSWAELAEAHQAGDINRLALLARRLKTRTEELKTRVIDLQEKLLENVARGE